MSERIWTINATGLPSSIEWSEGLLPPEANYGYESLDYGHQIALWIRAKDGSFACVRLTKAQAREFGKALAST